MRCQRQQIVMLKLNMAEEFRAGGGQTMPRIHVRSDLGPLCSAQQARSCFWRAWREKSTNRMVTESGMVRHEV
jgi:hypothetical protein